MVVASAGQWAQRIWHSGGLSHTSMEGGDSQWQCGQVGEGAAVILDYHQLYRFSIYVNSLCKSDQEHRIMCNDCTAHIYGQDARV